MDKEQVFAVIKQNIIDVVPELADRNITIKDSLRELGANSVDRAEIIVKTLAALQLKIPLVELGQAKNIEALVTIILEKMPQK